MQSERRLEVMKRLFLVSVIFAVVIVLSSCFLFGENYEPGDQMYDGKWYAEHDYELGDRVVKGVFDDSLMEWEEEYDNELSYSLIRCYDDGTQVDLLADVVDQNGLLRMACHVEDNTFLISGLPTWELTSDSYVKGEIVNYGGYGEGQVEGFLFTRTFSTTEKSEEKLVDIGTYQLKPINSAYTLTFDLRYLYQGSGSTYSEISYTEAAALGFTLSGGDNAWSGGTGYDTGNYARFLHNVTNAEVQAGQIILENCIAGGKYLVGGNIMLDDNQYGFPYANPGWLVTIDESNPNPVFEANIYLD